jgi:hypothetical protein
MPTDALFFASSYALATRNPKKMTVHMTSTVLLQHFLFVGAQVTP